MENIILNSSIYTSILFVAGLILKSYLTTRFETLAKNEDIEDITRKVEVIKKDLDLLTLQKFELFQEEKLAIFKFYKTSRALAFYVKNISVELEDFDISSAREQSTDAEEIFHEVFDRADKMVDAYNQLYIVIGNQELLKAATSIIDEQEKFKASFQNDFTKIYYIVENNQSYEYSSITRVEELRKDQKDKIEELISNIYDVSELFEIKAIEIITRFALISRLHIRGEEFSEEVIKNLR